MSRVLRFEITDKCNLNCEMCWSTNWKHEDMEMTTIKKIIEDFSRHEKNGIVVLTSREPLLSKNFESTLDLCTKLGLDIKILTNGTLLNDHFCNIITSYNVSFVGISLHGNREKHDSIVNVKGAFQKTIDGIKKLNFYKQKNNKENLEIRITSVISKDLINSVDEIVNIASMLNVDIRLQHIMWHSEETKTKNKFILKQEFNYDDNIIDGFPSKCPIDVNEIKEIIRTFKYKAKEKNVDLQIYPNLTDVELCEWYADKSDINIQNQKKFCDHCSTSIRLRANGKVSLCQYIDKEIGDLKVSNLDEVIYNNIEYKNICNKLENGELYPICYRCCHCRNDLLVENKKNYKI